MTSAGTLATNAGRRGRATRVMGGQVVLVTGEAKGIRHDVRALTATGDAWPLAGALDAIRGDAVDEAVATLERDAGGSTC